MSVQQASISSNTAIISQYIDLRIRKTRRTFLAQINNLLDWDALQKLLEQHYPKGQSNTGRKAYSPLLLLKMSLLQTWYGLSDYAVEEQVNDTLSFMRFCGLKLEDPVPDHSVLSRFRTSLSKVKAWDLLLESINAQLAERGIILKQGAIIDASITPSNRKPKGKKVHALRPESIPPVVALQQRGVDPEGAWVKKGGRLSYGYKRHYVTESSSGLVLSVETTSANAHESKQLSQCVSKARLPTGSRVYADKGYCSAANEKVLQGMCLRSGIQQKATRSKALTQRQKQFNKLVGKVRYKIERVFGSIKSWFGDLRARYVGQIRVHGQHVLEAIAYNLYRAPRLLVG